MLCALMMCGLSARAATLTVTSLADDGTVGTLRSQIAAAASGDTIDFSVTGTIQLVGSAAIAINKDLTIAGPGAGSLTVKGAVGYAVTIFEISGGIVSFSGLKLSNGKGKSIWTYNPGTETYGYRSFGGALYMTGGTVTLMDSIFSNSSANEGGAIYMDGGSLAVTSSTISNNICGATAYGGGINVRNGSLIVERSTISGNTAGMGHCRRHRRFRMAATPPHPFYWAYLTFPGANLLGHRHEHMVPVAIPFDVNREPMVTTHRVDWRK